VLFKRNFRNVLSLVLQRVRFPMTESAKRPCKRQISWKFGKWNNGKAILSLTVWQFYWFRPHGPQDMAGAHIKQRHLRIYHTRGIYTRPNTHETKLSATWIETSILTMCRVVPYS